MIASSRKSDEPLSIGNATLVPGKVFSICGHLPGKSNLHDFQPPKLDAK
jgi:hypothetical protein